MMRAPISFFLPPIQRPPLGMMGVPTPGAPLPQDRGAPANPYLAAFESALGTPDKPTSLGLGIRSLFDAAAAPRANDGGTGAVVAPVGPTMTPAAPPPMTATPRAAQMASASPRQSAGGGTPYQSAIAAIESAGSGDYGARGPVTRTGDRAFGRYQIMGANIPSWTQAALGRSMSPQEFLADKAAQDATFNHRFGTYVEKYGPERAARAWFAGEGGMNNPNARDQLGTSVGDYGARFMRGLGAADRPAPGANPVQAVLGPENPIVQALANADSQRAAIGSPDIGYPMSPAVAPLSGNAPPMDISPGAQNMGLAIPPPPGPLDPRLTPAPPINVTAQPAPQNAQFGPSSPAMTVPASGAVNWGNPDNPADFWRASKALQAQQAGLPIPADAQIPGPDDKMNLFNLFSSLMPGAFSNA